MQPVNYDRMTPRERRAIREAYIAEQHGICCYCHALLTEASPHEVNKTKVDWDRFPPNFLRWPVHLHHDHATGMTIGAVHAYCNAVSFDYDESPRRKG